MKNIRDNGLFVGKDNRTNRKSLNKTPISALNLVKEYINSFPKVESHYCRRDSSKLYLSSDLNKALMYRLYTDHFCKERNISPVSFFIYKQTFNAFDPQLSFFLPKKDQCFHCNANNNAIDKTDIENYWVQHKERVKVAIQMKSDDKKKSALDNGKSFRTISFDLQAILSLPFSGENQLYYKRKLNVYNFTIFDSYKNEGYCYVWDECSGKKGSAEIGTCLINYLSHLTESVTHVSTFSDTCGGQNRNKNILAAMLYAVNCIDNIETIDVKFMESGHSYLEADTIHGTIERHRKYKKVFTTREWALLFSSTRIKPSPYKVTTMHYNEFYNLEKLVGSMIQNTNLNTEKEKVNWLKIKWMKFQKNEPYIMQYKYDQQETVFKKLNTSMKRGAGRKQEWTSVNLDIKYSKKYLSVKQRKKT